MSCDSSERCAAHIDLHRLFTPCQTLNISATVIEVTRGGERNTERERERDGGKERVNKKKKVSKLKQRENTTFSCERL